MRRVLLLASFSAALGAGLASADPVPTPPMGTEFVVNTDTTGFQYLSSVAMDGAGNFVVAWDSYDGSGYGVAARTFDSTGAPLSPEFAVNTYTTGGQYNNWVAADRNGDFVIVWTSYGQVNPTDSEVYARRYTGGQPTGPEFRVNTYTTGEQFVSGPTIAMAASGEFVIVWSSYGQDGDGYGVFAQRFDAGGNKLGGEFQVNTYTTGSQTLPTVAMSADHSFVVAWQSYGQDGDNYGVFARRYDGTGVPVTGEIPVNTTTTGVQIDPTVATDRDGNFVVVWDSVSQDGSFDGVFGRRFGPTGSALTGEFAVNSYTSDIQDYPLIAMDPDGNFVCTWRSYGEDGDGFGVFAQAFDSSAARVGVEFQVNQATTGAQELPAIATGHHGNFVITWGGESGADEDVFARLSAPSAAHADVDVHTVTGTASNMNGVLEAGETVQVETRWANVLGAPFSVSGAASNIRGPAGPTYTLNDGTADYGSIAAHATSDCFTATGDCYLVSVSGARPAPHWDVKFDELLSTNSIKTWTLHVGESFPDVPTTDNFYTFVETLFHNEITGGCGGGNYCPANSVTRSQMAVFLLKSVHGAAYLPPACAGVFGDVPCPSQFADWIEELAAEGITGGCGGGNYCPSSPVTRAQMAVFLLKAEHGSTYVPPTCTGIFGDVPCPSTFANWIEQLSTEGITGGCGGGNYCPNNPNTRGQMAVFLTKTFGFQLYPP